MSELDLVQNVSKGYQQAIQAAGKELDEHPVNANSKNQDQATHMCMCSLISAVTLNSLPANSDLSSANSLDPDQERHNVGPDLDPNRLTL